MQPSGRYGTLTLELFDLFIAADLVHRRPEVFGYLFVKADLMNKIYLHTRNGHYIVGYDDEPFALRTNSQQKWFVKMGVCERQVLDWRSECVRAAQEIRASTDLPIVVCLSGGVDSEVVAESFRMANIQFECAVMRFQNDLNIHDISWAVIYCERHRIPYKIYEIDIQKFLRDEGLQIAIEAQSITPLISAQIKLMTLIQQSGGFPVTGTGEYHIRYVNDWRLSESEFMAAFERYFVLHPGPGVIRFFRWSPEIVLSYLLSPFIRQMVARPGPHPQFDLNSLKLKIYGQAWSLVERPKYFGGEKMRKFHDELLNELKSRFIDSMQEVSWSYREIVEKLAGTNPIPTSLFE